MQKHGPGGELWSSIYDVEGTVPAYLRGLLVCCRQRGEAQARLAVADRDGAVVHIYDTRSGSDDPVASSADVHRAPVVAMRYNEPHDTVISTDAKGAQKLLQHDPRLWSRSAPQLLMLLLRSTRAEDCRTCSVRLSTAFGRQACEHAMHGTSLS